MVVAAVVAVAALSVVAQAPAKPPEAPPKEGGLAGVLQAPGASGALKELFVNQRHDVVARTKNFMHVVLTCPSLRGSIGTESCVRDDLERIDAVNYFIEMEGDEFITAVVVPGEDALIFADGVVRAMRPEGDVVQADVDVVIERAPRDPVLEKVLFVDKRKGPKEFAGPLLSAEARKALSSLPSSFTLVAGVPSRRFVEQPCQGEPATFSFATSLLGQASYFESSGLPGSSTTVTPITDVAATSKGVRVTLKKGKPFEIVWPMAENDVALRGDKTYAASRAKFPTREHPNCH